jgi:hypothetical protein
MRIYAIAASCACVMLMANPSFAQRTECRPPTAQESEALHRAASALRTAIEGPVSSVGWILDSRNDQGPLSVAAAPNPKRPLMTCSPIFDVKFVMSPSHPRHAEFEAQIAKGRDAMTRWVSACLNTRSKDCEVRPADAEIGIRATSATRITIRVTENEPYMRDPATDEIHKIAAPEGVAVAWQSAVDNYEQDTNLCFGDWKPGDVFATSRREMLFPFVHPVQTPFIENLCVRLHSGAGIVDGILNAVRWSGLNAALTK